MTGRDRYKTDTCYKLFITLARFVDGEKVIRKEEKIWKPVKEKDASKSNMDEKLDDVVTKVVGDRPAPSVVGHRSFRDTLVNKELDIGEIDISVSPNIQAFSQWNGVGLIGRVKDFDCIVSMEDDEGTLIPDVQETEVPRDRDGNRIEEEVIMEESGVGGNEENVVTDGQTEGSIPKVREVFSKHFKDTTQGKESKKKRGKFSRKKSRGEKSISPSEHDRPKKRSRDEDDPFDVDRFIFNFNEGSNGSQNGDQVQGSPINFLTPDLNREVVVEDVNHAGAHVDSGPETFS
ncbi:hypothetical protein L1987_75926 [Smallanthus sonchifolius]|uniref:Uncharacterized protein n=1 Tax=Smallanthus sonchifolius TaxID=185202 RepID=A0ACB9AB88_9ASTR|nr:hypothetical protein L1987_75926 [Smallanthus sonchifolius]